MPPRSGRTPWTISWRSVLGIFLIVCALGSLYYEASFGQLGRLSNATRSSLLLRHSETPSRKVSCDRGIAAASGQEFCCRGTFNCGDALRKEIPCTQVNDNYCDCSNGKDEPGTSACSARGARFSCTGGPETIPTAFVDDGFVDCQNGSDES